MTISESTPGHRALSLTTNESLTSSFLAAALQAHGIEDSEEVAQQCFDALEESLLVAA